MYYFLQIVMNFISLDSGLKKRIQYCLAKFIRLGPNLSYISYQLGELGEII